LRAVSGRGSLQKAARTLVAAMHGRWEIDTATRNSLCDGTFHARPHGVMILMLKVTSSVDTYSLRLAIKIFFVCQRGSASLGPRRASPAVHSDLHAFPEETRATRRCEWPGLSRQMRKTLEKTTSLVVCNVTRPSWYILLQRRSVLQVRSTRWPLGIRVRVAGSRPACTA
jgi:hypothetical protein